MHTTKQSQVWSGVSRLTWALLLLGLLARVLIMPWAMHADLLSMSWRAQLMAYHSQWGLLSSQWLGHAAYAANLWLWHQIGISFEPMFENTEFGLTPTSQTASVGDWLRFVQEDQINTFLFVAKLPHLLADVSTMALLLWLVLKLKPKLQSWVVLVWWLNPVNVYVFYLFGRHDALSSLALLLMVVATSFRWWGAAIISLFGAVLIRVQPLLFVPWLTRELLVANWSWKFVKQVVMTMVIVATSLLCIQALPFDQLQYEQLKAIETTPTIVTTEPSLLRSLGIPTNHFRRALGELPWFIVPAGLALLLIPKSKFVKNLDENSVVIANWGLLGTFIMSWYFILNSFSPHYFVWLSFWATLAVVAVGKKAIWPYLLAVIAWGVMGVFGRGHFAINQWLLLPISEYFFTTPLPWQILESAAGSDQLRQVVVGGAHWVLRLSLLWLSWVCWQKLRLMRWREVVNLAKQKQTEVKRLIKLVVVITIVGMGYEAVLTPAQAVIVPVQEQSIQAKQTSVELNSNQTRRFSVPVSSDGTVGIIYLQFDVARQNSDQVIEYKIREERQTRWWHSGQINRSDLYHRAWYPLGLPELNMSQGDVLEIELQAVSDSTLSAIKLLGVTKNRTFTPNYRLATDGSWREWTQTVLSDITSKFEQQSVFVSLWVMVLLALTGIGVGILLSSSSTPRT